MRLHEKPAPRMIQKHHRRSSGLRIQLDTASISQIDYYADGNCAVRLVNDTSHLR